MKEAFIVICIKITLFWKWLLGIAREISTFFREGGKDSPLSSRRLFAAVFVVAFIYTIDIALRKFTDLLQYGWIAALIFIPSVICGVFAVVYSYFASIGDIRDTLKEVKGVIAAGKSA